MRKILKEMPRPCAPIRNSVSLLHLFTKPEMDLIILDLRLSIANN